ncbi:beta-N-acetylhexosaminidase [Paenibacillus sp. N4]|nr:beta-N-acetylhexosaminidase [Paenibacillus vietnamensis]
MLVMTTLLAGCGHPPQTGNPSPSPSPSASAAVPPTTEPVETPGKSPSPSPSPSDPVIDQLASLTVNEKIGQLVIVGLEGTAMTAQTKTMIEKYHVGGFILYKDNIADVPQTISLLNALKKANSASRAPLWLSVDQEGGKVNRMPDPIMNTPEAQQIGKANDRSYTQQIGEAIGEELLALGFNMDFAPVLDINSNPDNPVIGSRSFGSDAQKVTVHGLEMMEGIRSKQVAAVVKHFPGHGDTSVDSHLELPVVHKSLSELQSFELQPFKEAVGQEADAIMIAHLLLPHIDKTYPASLSKELITGLLRDSLGYDGVVMTDDMTMGGIVKNFSIGNAAVRSVQAGSDILLIGHDPKLQIAVLNALRKAVEDQTITEERLDQSVLRILRLKAKYGLKDSPAEQTDPAAINRIIEEALQTKTKS